VKKQSLVLAEAISIKIKNLQDIKNSVHTEGGDNGHFYFYPQIVTNYDSTRYNKILSIVNNLLYVKN